MPDVVRSIEVKAPPSAVWRWFADQASLRRWLSPNLDIDLRVGGSYGMFVADDSTRISGTVLELEPEGRLVMSWLEEGAGWSQAARLVISLDETEGGTTVSLVHDGFERIGSDRWEDIAGAYERGADRHRVLERLAELATTDGA